MSVNSSFPWAKAAVAGGMTTQSTSDLVIDNLDEFSVGILACATSADYAIGSL
jgi:hypothetical protein